MRVDVHQHVWTDPLLARLGARQTLPLVRHSNGLTVLHSVAEQPYVIEVATEAAEQRAALVRRDGLDLALIAISSPLWDRGAPARKRPRADRRAPRWRSYASGRVRGLGSGSARRRERRSGRSPARARLRRDLASRRRGRGTGRSHTRRTDSRANRSTPRPAVGASWSVARPVACRRVVRRGALVARADRLRSADAGSVVHVRLVWAPRAPRAQRHLYDARRRRAAAPQTPGEPRRTRNRFARIR